MRAAQRLSARGRGLLAVLVLATTVSVLPTGAVLAAVSETSAERFGGRDRYETSVAVAEAYLEAIADNPDRSDVSTAIVVSGEDRHSAYAMTAAGLASAFDAPILLTRSDELVDFIAEFIEAQSFELIVIVGGPSVVSGEVESDLATLAERVRRIGGADAYATSAAVAAEVGPIPGSAGEWGSRGRTALLANGDTVADALVAGPLAYNGEHPLLLTPAGVLDAAVSAYLDRSDVEHVVILGGTAAVSSAVDAAVKEKDIATSRVAGSNRFETATLLADLLLGSGRPDPCFDGSQVGLARGDRAPDATSSGPLLGEFCAPLLLTQSRVVPLEVDEFLVAAEELGGVGQRLEFAIFGGTAAIADSTATVARSRALRGAPFAAEVSATGGSTTFTVSFNEDVKDQDEDNNRLVTAPTLYTVNNAELVLEVTDPENQRQYTDISLNGRIVTIELVEPLQVGDLITVIGERGTAEGRSEIAVDDTLPALESVFYRVPRPPVVGDTEGPAITIVAVAGQPRFVVAVAETALRAGDRLRNDVVWRGAPKLEVTVTDMDGAPKRVTFITSEEDCPAKQDATSPRAGLPDSPAEIGEQCYEDPATLGANLRYTAEVEQRLQPGDVITVQRGALHDQRRNANRLTRYTVREHADNADHGDFVVERVAVGNPRHTSQASLLIRNEPHENRSRLRITARSSGAAAGAAGNGWFVYPYVDPDRTEPADSVIEVGVDPVHRIISYTIVDGKITLANLAAALNADTKFRRHFSARVLRSGTLRCRVATADEAVAVDPLEIGDPAGAPMCGGFSAVGVRVQFTDHVASVTGAAADFAAPESIASLFLDGRNAADPDVAVRCVRRGPVVYLEYVATDDRLLPRAGRPTLVPGGLALNYRPNDPNDRSDVGVASLVQRRFNLRHDATIPARLGYGTDDELQRDGADLRCDGGTS